MQANGNSQKMVSDINVTPLVDVMLVLLIIFMVTAPMMTQGVDVKLPESSAPAISGMDKIAPQFLVSEHACWPRSVVCCRVQIFRIRSRRRKFRRRASFRLV